MIDALPFLRQEIDHTIVARWRRVVQQFPAHSAVTTPDGEQVTYQALDARADAIACALIERLGVDNAPVVLFLEHEPRLIAAIIGVLKANKAYVALGPAQTTDLTNITRAPGAPRLIITTRALYASVLSTAASYQDILLLDDVAAARSCPEVEIAPDAPAALFFTSGTVGQPKGVPYSHQLILHRIWVETNTYHLTAGDRCSGLRPCGVAASIRDVFNALLNGGALCLYPVQHYGLGQLSTWLLEQQITYFHLPGALYREWLASLPANARFPAIRYLSPSGRKTSRDCALTWPHLAEHASLISTYATTETSLLSQQLITRETPLAEDVLAVGRPVPDKHITLVDEHDQPVAAGQVGEIVVRSRYIAGGYWQQPELSAQRFSSTHDGSGEITYRTGDFGRLRSDGALELAGRRDSQVKVRGYRVLLEDVESLLTHANGVAQAAAKAFPLPGGDSRLVGYVTGAPGAQLSASKIRNELAAQTAAHMVPTQIMVLPELPLTRTGKVDRQALPAPDSARPALDTPLVKPRNQLERQLADLWARLLALEEVGIDDNFFELGGDSILAMRMLLSAESVIGPIPPHAYPRVLTIRALAELVRPDNAAAAAGLGHASPWQVLRPAHSPDQSMVQRWGTVSPPTALRWAARQSLFTMNYRQGMAWLHWLAQPAIAHRLFRQEAQWLRTLAAEMDAPAPDEQATVRANIIGNMLQSAFRASRWRHGLTKGGLTDLHTAPVRFWRSFARQLAWAPVNERKRMVQFHGLEHLVHAQRQGHGAILVTYHSAVSDLADIALAHITSIGRIFTVSFFRATLVAEQAGEDEIELLDAATGLAAYYTLHAHRILQQGGVVRFGNDYSYDHPNTLTKQIGRRLYSLKPGFAELALLTGAAVLPAYSHCDPAGAIHLTLLPAMTLPDTRFDHDRQLHALLDQYVAFLNETWRSAPASMGWGALRRYHSRPLADSSTPPGGHAVNS